MQIKSGHLLFDVETSSMAITITAANRNPAPCAIVWRDGSSANVYGRQVFTETGSGVDDIPRLQQWAFDTIHSLCVPREDGG